MADESYFIVDDVIDQAGHEGFEVMFGDPATSIGVSCFKSIRLWRCVEYIKKHIVKGERFYRVRLARRHGTHSVKEINAGFKTHTRFGFLISRTAGPDAPWRGWREDGKSFRADTLQGAFKMAKEMK